MEYTASEQRYETMKYRRVGKSGLLFPILSLGFWHNFGTNDNYENMKAMCFTAFDHGITQFDLANNYYRNMAVQRVILAGSCGKNCMPTAMNC